MITSSTSVTEPCPRILTDNRFPIFQNRETLILVKRVCSRGFTMPGLFHLPLVSLFVYARLESYFHHASYAVLLGLSSPGSEWHTISGGGGSRSTAAASSTAGPRPLPCLSSASP